VTLALVLTRTAESDALIYGAIVSDDGGLANNDSRSVVDKDASADLGGGMDLNIGPLYATL